MPVFIVRPYILKVSLNLSLKCSVVEIRRVSKDKFKEALNIKPDYE